MEAADVTPTESIIRATSSSAAPGRKERGEAVVMMVGANPGREKEQIIK
jgi:hypothetical protein